MATEQALPVRPSGRRPAGIVPAGAAGPEMSLSSLAVGAAHDFKNLLFVITAHCQRLSQSVGREDARRADVDAIAAAADRCVGLTQQLLEAGRGATPPRRTVDLTKVTLGLAALLQRLVGDRVRLETHLADGLWPVLANAVQMEQIVINLAANARDAMPDGGTLTITTRNQPDPDGGDAVVLTVGDTGGGMTADVQARMFDPYFTTKGSAGTGVGLATVRGIVAGAGGRLEVDSAPGQGTRIDVVLPRDGVTLSPPRPHHSGRPSSPHPPRVLLVEDEPAVRALLAHCLETEGYELILAASGTEALELCMGMEASLDLIVTDMNLPDVLGPEVARRLRERVPGLGVVFMSGEAEASGRNTDGPVLAKPFSLAEFNRTVRGALDLRGAA